MKHTLREIWQGNSLGLAWVPPTILSSSIMGHPPRISTLRGRRGSVSLPANLAVVSYKSQYRISFVCQQKYYMNAGILPMAPATRARRIRAVFMIPMRKRQRMNRFALVSSFPYITSNGGLFQRAHLVLWLAVIDSSSTRPSFNLSSKNNKRNPRFILSSLTNNTS